MTFKLSFLGSKIRMSQSKKLDEFPPESDVMMIHLPKLANFKIRHETPKVYF